MKRIYCLCLVLALCFSLAGCGNNQDRVSKAYKKSSSGESVSSQTLASNDRFELLWEDSVKVVQIKNNKTGKIWSNIPYEYYLAEGFSSKVNSTINITVAQSSNLATEIVRGYDAVSNTESKTIKDGIRLTYYFDAYKISVPVDYVLKSDHLEVTVDVKNIREDNDYKLVSVDVDPFFCSTRNESDNSYLFIPVGSGSLMSNKASVDGTQTFSGDVYGIDASAIAEEYITDETKIRMPVYGAKDGNDSLFCIINEADGSAVINAEAGNNRTGYSNVYATFYVRGYDTFAVDTTTAQLGGTQYKLFSDYISINDIKLSYYPLSDDDADYSGMAKCYRNYLIKNYSLSTPENKTVSFGLDIIGGTEITTTTMGVPHDKTVALTDFNSALSIIKDMSSFSTKPSVRMLGYGDSGIIPGRICGGFSFSGLYGKESDRKSIDEYTDSNGIKLFYDFDLIRYSKSGGGFTKTFDSAQTASARTAQGSAVQTPLRSNIGEKFNFLKREKINKAASSLNNFIDKKGIKGVSVNTFGEIAYSDFSNSAYEVKGNLLHQSKEIFKALSQNKRTLSTGANFYAAIYASDVYNVPVDNGEYLALSQSIPFYQMVFGGLKTLYALPANTAENYDNFLVDCISSGTCISFSVISDYDIRYSEKDQTYIGLDSVDLYALKYDSSKELIKSTLKKYGKYYDKIGNSYITGYNILENGITVTEFSNGIKLYANHTNTATVSPIGNLEAFSVKIAD